MKHYSLHKNLLLLLMAGLTAVFFRSLGTHDIATWLKWGHDASVYGIVEGYTRDGNLYPPLTNVLLWLSYAAASIIGIAPVITLKFLLLVFLLVTTGIFYHWSGKNLFASAIFYIAMLISSLGLGYLDILFAAPLLLALYFLQQNKLTHFALCFLIACLIKFPPVLVAPFFIIYLASTMIRQTHRLPDIKQLCMQTVLPCVLLLVPVLFLFGKTLLIALLKTGNAPWLSAWALNFNWIVTRVFLQNGWGTSSPPWFEATVAIMNPVPDSARILAHTLYLFFFLSTLLTFLLRRKSLEHLLLYSLLGSFAYFMFYTGVHENHLFLTCILAAALFCVNQEYLYLMLGILFISTLNLFVFYGVSGSASGGFVFHPDLSSAAYSYWSDAPLLIAACNTLYFLILWCCTVLPEWRSREQN